MSSGLNKGMADMQKRPQTSKLSTNNMNMIPLYNNAVPGKSQVYQNFLNQANALKNNESLPAGAINKNVTVSDSYEMQMLAN